MPSLLNWSCTASLMNKAGAHHPSGIGDVPGPNERRSLYRNGILAP